ncbi:hypothetical protein HA402_012474 [Bradysia odoriphaga]|nr:hypothetical protein HA402_012474 [Bradysia odoriphaga]
MFSKYSTLASILLKRGLADPTSLVLSRHSNVFPYRLSNNKIRRNYCESKTQTDIQAINRPLSNEILEVLDGPDKVGRDHKHYRVLKLKNGLTALLISDPILHPLDKVVDGVKATGSPNERETDIEKLAACSVSVNVGSFSDPRDIQGMAHFLEHMVFMGTSKYPHENEFDQYIKRCAGFNNAETDSEDTSYYIEVADKCLPGALDRFSQFFKDPLLLKEAMRRERQAVDSEFQLKMQGDDVRKEQLLASMGNPDHPCSLFSWGNFRTLRDNISDDELHSRVHAFRKRHYSANRMFVCIQAQYSLDVIQDLLLKHFSDIPNNRLPGCDYSHFSHLNAFQECFSNQVYVVKPTANMSKLELTFCMEPLAQEYRTKRHHFVAYLLGYEGHGSLISYLRKKNWALELATGLDSSGFGSNQFYSLFKISVYLTSNGMNNIKGVLAAIFGCIKYLEIVDPKTHGEVLYREIQSIEATNYHFRREPSPLQNVENLVTNLKQYPPKDLLTGPSLFFEYDYNAIQTFIEKMYRSKKNIMITTKKPFEGREFDRLERWCGTQYCTFDIPADWAETWKNPQILDDFKLPEPNIYIPTNLSIVYKPGTLTVSTHPTKILENDVCQLWFRQDDRFLLPISFYYFNFISPMARGSIENVVMLSVYTMLLRYKVVETLYPATVAGLSYSTLPFEKGMFLKFSGYSQNLHHLVKAFIGKLLTFADEITEEEFNMFAEQQLKNYFNTMINTKAYAKALRLSIIDNEFYPTNEKYEALKKLTFGDFKQYAKRFLKELKMQALFQGNLDEDTALTVMNDVLNQLKPQPIVTSSAMALQAYRLPVGSHYFRCASFNPNDVNSLTCNFYQIGPMTVKTLNLIELLMMLAEEPLFNTLRSKEQLGYDVSCGLRDNYGILGYSIMVNSQENKFSSEYIDERIEAFRSELLNIISRTTDHEFQQYKESLAKIKLNDDNDMKDEVARHWIEIITDEYAFDRAIRDVECLNTITKSDFVEFFQKHLDHTRKLSIQIIGVKDPTKNTITHSKDRSAHDNEFRLKMIPLSKPFKGYCIQSIPEFIKNLELYPVIRTNFKCEE